MSVKSKKVSGAGSERKRSVSTDSRSVSIFSSHEFPFNEVKLSSFKFSAKDREEAAFLQYSLLLKPEILQAHLDFSSKRGWMVSITNIKPSPFLADFGMKVKMISVEWLSYADYKKRNSC
ncbi:MAG: hypothetical protein NTY48_01025 [Candidatus Diapherotrites archaeon]|nr:hypothetical protein [Candidatus Diapherotrites archaeon]